VGGVDRARMSSTVSGNDTSLEEQIRDLSVNDNTTAFEDEHDDETQSRGEDVSESFVAGLEDSKSNSDAVGDGEESLSRNGLGLLGHISGEDTENGDEDTIEGRRVIGEFLQSSTCYEIIPESSKVVVFDRKIPIRLSYYALVEHEIGAAPLWDPLTQRLTGIITTLDFIEMLRFGYQTNSVQEILDSHSVASWRSLVTQLCDSPEIADSLAEAGMPAVSAAAKAAEYEKLRPTSIYTNPERALVSLSPDDTLFDACCYLRENGAHWLPIVDVAEQICLGVATHLAMLQYLVTHFVEERQLFEQEIQTLGIGTFRSETQEMITATLNSPVHEILDLMAEHRVSCVPILGDDGRPIAVYARTNVIDLISHNSLENSLDMSLGSLIFGAERFEAGDFDLEEELPERMCMHICRVTDSLQQVFVKFAQVRVHRLLYVDEDGKLEGIVSLSDLLSYFIE